MFSAVPSFRKAQLRVLASFYKQWVWRRLQVVASRGISADGRLAGPASLWEQEARDSVPALKKCAVLWESRNINGHFRYNVRTTTAVRQNAMEILFEGKLPRDTTWAVLEGEEV